MNWIDRYIYAVTRHLPAAQRDDIEQELRGLIDDLLQKRTGGRTATEEDVKAVLTGLGQPRKLADNYRGQPRHLIGPAFFDLYWLVLRIVLLAVGVSVIVALTVQMAVQPPATFWQGLSDVLGGIWQSLLGAFAMVTVIFALNEQYNPQAGKLVQGIGNSWKADDLPDIPSQSLRIKKSDPIAAIILSLIFMVIINTDPGVIGAYIRENGAFRVVPLFSHVFADALVWISLTLVIGIILECIKLITGRWTLILAGLHILLKLPSLIVGVWLFANPGIFNPAFFNALDDLFRIDKVMMPAATPEILRKVILFLIIFGFVVDTVTAAVKAGRILLQGKS